MQTPQQLSEENLLLRQENAFLKEELWLTETLRKLPETKLSELHTLLPIKKQDA